MNDNIKNLKDRINTLECDKDELQLDLRIAQKKLTAIDLINSISVENDLDTIICLLETFVKRYAEVSCGSVASYNLHTIINNLSKNGYAHEDILNYLHVIAYDIAKDSKAPDTMLNGIIITDEMKTDDKMQKTF